MTASVDRWADVYRDIHANPELGFAETRTASIAGSHLVSMGFEVTAGVGGTGVVGLVRNGPGPTVLVRADMDALPVLEATGLPYASTQVSSDAAGKQTPLMHACGHDLHVACLLGACERLAGSRDTWAGTLMAVFQPAEEAGDGARAMIDDGLYTRFGKPAVILGQHVAPLPAGMIGLRAGAAFAAADSLKVTLYGQGAHGSRPDASVDPIVMAAATVLRLQTIVSREIPAGETAVVTIGSIHAGTAANIIPDRAELGLSIRTFSTEVRDRVLAVEGRPVEPLPYVRARHRAHTVHRDRSTDGRRDDLAPALSRAAGPRPGGACPLVSVLECESAVAEPTPWTSPQRLDVRLSPWRLSRARRNTRRRCGRGDRVRRRRLDFDAAKTRPQPKYAKLSFRWHAYRSWLYPRAGYRYSGVHGLQKCPRGSNRKSDN